MDDLIAEPIRRQPVKKQLHKPRQVSFGHLSAYLCTQLAKSRANVYAFTLRGSTISRKRTSSVGKYNGTSNQSPALSRSKKS